MSGLSQAVQYMRRGDVGALGYGMLKKVSKAIGGVRIVAETIAPAHLSTNTTTQMQRDVNDKSSFKTVIADKKEINIHPEHQFNRLEFTLLDIDKLHSAKIEITGNISTGKSETKTVRICHSDREQLSTVPVAVEFDSKVDSASVIFTTDPPESSQTLRHRVVTYLWDAMGQSSFPSKYAYNSGHQVTPPIINAATEYPPIFLISVDTLRWDQKTSLQPLIDAFDGTAEIPAEPRSQGYWTPTSHATMFTGVHPSVHGYHGHNQSLARPIKADLITIPELLFNLGYHCSGLVATGKLLPQFGFGKGFHEYDVEHMNWVSRDGDARHKVNRVIQHLEQRGGPDRPPLFYFLHLNDAHLPYLPPPAEDMQDFDLGKLDQFREQSERPYSTRNKSDGVHSPCAAMADEIDTEVFDYYESSVNFVARQLRKLINNMKDIGIFEDSLIIITGDHGEDWGERGYYHHDSLYDANIRPFMLFKPPQGESWDIPECADTMDFLPTIAQTIGEPVPEQCQGQPLQSKTDGQQPRIIERFGTEYYNLAVERDGKKGIFTFGECLPSRPDISEIESAVLDTEFIDVKKARKDGYDSAIGSVSPTVRDDLTSLARQFFENDPGTHQTNQYVNQLDGMTEGQLEYLGYK